MAAHRYLRLSFFCSSLKIDDTIIIDDCIINYSDRVASRQPFTCFCSLSRIEKRQRQFVCAEINVDYSQFYLSDMHEHLESEQRGVVDKWINILNRQRISFISAAQYHYAWVRMEAWENEPPAVQGSWDIMSELALTPHSGMVILSELMGGSAVSLELVPGNEPDCTYQMSASCRGREALVNAEVDDEDDPFPHGLEQYLLQFWPRRP